MSPLSEKHTLMLSLHVWLNTSAIQDNARSDVQCAEYVLMFVCLASEGEGRIGPEIEMFHENITTENRFTVKASFIMALEELRLVCSIRAPFFCPNSLPQLQCI